MNWRRRKLACWEHKFVPDENGGSTDICSHEENPSGECCLEKCPKESLFRKKTGLNLYRNHDGNIYDSTLNLEVDIIGESPVYKIVQEFACSVVDHQEEIIMRHIQQIGGKKYEEITIDHGKVELMLRKAMPIKIRRTDAYPHRLYCPTCHNTLVYNEMNQDIMRANLIYNNCPGCGQTLDWVIDGEENDA